MPNKGSAVQDDNPRPPLVTLRAGHSSPKAGCELKDRFLQFKGYIFKFMEISNILCSLAFLVMTKLTIKQFIPFYFCTSGLKSKVTGAEILLLLIFM